jgi:membrane-associated phospholipid phosphatase
VFILLLLKENYNTLTFILFMALVLQKNAPKDLPMNLKIFVIACLVSVASTTGYSQQTDTIANKLDSLKKQTDTTGQNNLVEPGFYNEKTHVSFKVFGVLLLNDFKQQALSPLDINGRGWLMGAAFTVGTFGMGYLDKPIQKWAVNFRNNNPGSAPYSRTITDLGGAYVVIPFAATATYGFIFKNEKLRTTTYLATQAYITSTAWSTLFKTLSGRLRPGSWDPNSPLNVPTFHGPFSNLPYGGNSSFPSGHTTLAFAAATVYAKEYKYIPVVPVISYSVATLIAFSRVTENRHWLTDLLAGAALGVACGTQVVNNYHRYAKLIRTNSLKKKKKGDLTFNLGYTPGVGLQPGFVYKFR